MSKKTKLARYPTVTPTLAQAKREGRAEQLIYAPFIKTDGGRSAYFDAIGVGDCVCRAIVVATGFDYKRVYDRLAHGHMLQHGNATARTGIYTCAPWFRKLMRDMGFVYTNFDASECQIRLRKVLPKTGKHVISIHRHYVACVNGVLYDTGSGNVSDWNVPVNGFWTLEGKAKVGALRFTKPARKRVPWVYSYKHWSSSDTNVYSCNSRDMQEVINYAYKTFKPSRVGELPAFYVERTRKKNGEWFDEETYLCGDEWDGDFTPPKAFIDKVRVCRTRFKLFADRVR